MLKKYLKIFFHALIIALFFVLQRGFLNGVFAFSGEANALLVILVFLLVFSKFELSIIYALAFSLLFEAFSFYPGGLYLFSLLVTVVVTNFLLVNFFTNRSLYSVLVLTFFSSIIFSLVFYSFLALHNFIFLPERTVFCFKVFLQTELQALFFNLLIALIIFYLLNFLTKKVQPTFLIRTRQF